MSPFAIFLKKLRVARGYKQKNLAHDLGYEPSYLSALERSEKGPPREDFVTRLIKGLDLDQTEQEQLYTALLASRRQFSIPPTASEREYALIHRLEPQLGQLHAIQIELIEIALSLPVAFGKPPF